MLRKTLIFLLASAMLVLAACGEAENGAADAPDTPPAAADTAPAEPAPADTAVPEERLPVRGQWAGNVYTNDYLGVRFSMPDNWAAATDAEIAEVIGVGLDMMGAEFSPELWDSGLEIVDMMATCMDTGTTVQVMFERLVFPRSRLTEQDYIAEAAAMLQDMGMSTRDIVGTTRIGSVDWYSYGSSMEIMPGFNVDGQYFISREGDFMRVIAIIYSELSPPVSEILAMFSGL